MILKCVFLIVELLSRSSTGRTPDFDSGGSWFKSTRLRAGVVTSVIIVFGVAKHMVTEVTTPRHPRSSIGGASDC